MAFCSTCGTSVNCDGRCPSCNTVRSSQHAGISTIPANVAALLSYSLSLFTGVFFLSVLPFKQNRFIRFHALQAVFFSIAAIAFNIVWSVITAILATRVGLLIPVMAITSQLLPLAWVGYWVFLMYQAYRNIEYRIPILGNLAATMSLREPIDGTDASSGEVPIAAEEHVFQGKVQKL